ncbi:MAG: hypothetical protein KDC95_08915 [Planctomycetes bacterium]|nr:hypothetical protein [Planctomycetota bacterium]
MILAGIAGGALTVLCMPTLAMLLEAAGSLSWSNTADPAVEGVDSPDPSLPYLPGVGAAVAIVFECAIGWASAERQKALRSGAIGFAIGLASVVGFLLLLGLVAVFSGLVMIGPESSQRPSLTLDFLILCCCVMPPIAGASYGARGARAARASSGETPLQGPRIRRVQRDASPLMVRVSRQGRREDVSL